MVFTLFLQEFNANTMSFLYKPVSIIILFIFIVSCGDKQEQSTPITKPDKNVKPPVKKVQAPEFDADSAYNFIQKQVDFGPRVPNTEAHKKCGNYLAEKLREYGASVIEQTGRVRAFNDAKLNIKNIIAQFQPEKKKRLMLFAHWDTRPFADRDTKNIGKPIDGANDGGSGVGVLLEIGRLLKDNPTQMGVDIILFDAEDYGSTNSNMFGKQMLDDWCLGTQYWANNPPIKNYHPRYGILLDMVGAKDAVFPKEYLSVYFAENVVDKVWEAAHNLGYGQYFLNKKMPPNTAITDDHKYVNNMAKIPSIDIIHYDPKTLDFGHFHHTHKDNMDVIDKNTLKAVGQTVLHVIYNETP